ncbi:ROK family protein [Rhizobium sp. YIM 134829]|uniref:ROK family protein n=1 Tax=Rhizobium sp. YIM 134829 TaxID=3390453 RepID=UPI0039799DB5
MTRTAEFPLPLTESARAVFHRIVEVGQATRPMLSSALEFSKPTMSAAILELSNLGLVHPTGTTQGATGRTATLYGLGHEVGYVIGVDAGVTQVRAIAQTLDGTILAEVDKLLPPAGRLTSDTGKAVQTVLQELRQFEGNPRRPLRAISLAVPVIVSENHPELASGLDEIKASIGDSAGAEIVLENNVNCAAIAEMDLGAARGRPSFAFLQIGVNIGLGLVHEGRLLRGANGAAGEVTRLPFPFAPLSRPRRRGLEDHISSLSLMERVGADWTDKTPAPDNARDLFRLAEEGVPSALRHVERHARDIGLVAASVVAICDPGLIVLGGGVGQNGILVPIIEELIADLAWPTEVITTELPVRGTVLGASQLAMRRAVKMLTGDEHLRRAG